MKLYVNTATTDDDSVLGIWDFVVTEEGIIVSNDKCSSTFKWHCIESIEKDAHNLYLFTDKIKALILPLSQINEKIEFTINKNVISAFTINS